MSRKHCEAEIPTKIGGWDGRFVVERPVLPEGYRVVESTRGALAHEWQEPANHEKITQHSRHETSNSCEQQYQQFQQQQQQQQQQHQQKVQYTNSNSNQYNVPVSHNGPREHYVKIERDVEERSGNVRTNSNCVNQSSTNYNVNSERVLPHQTYYNGQQSVNVSNQNRNTSNYIPYGSSNYIPYGSTGSSSNYEKTSQSVRNVATGNNYHGYTTETEVLPPRWDGKFPPNYLQGRPKPHQNQSSVNDLYGFSTDPEILPTTWDGTFGKSGGTYFVPDRNRSATNDFYGYNTQPTILPTTWNGKFQLDPNDVRIKPERNVSDVRDYADHRNFYLRSK